MRSAPRLFLARGAPHIAFNDALSAAAALRADVYGPERDISSEEVQQQRGRWIGVYWAVVYLRFGIIFAGWSLEFIGGFDGLGAGLDGGGLFGLTIFIL